MSETPAERRARIDRRNAAIAETTGTPRGKPPDGLTYGRREELTPKQRAARAKAIREHDAKQAERE